MSRNKGSFSFKSNFLSRPILAGVFSFVFLFLLGFFLLFQSYQIIRESEAREMINVMDLVEKNLNNSLKDSYSVALSMGLIIDDEGNIRDFEQYAPLLLEQYPVIDVVQMVPGGVIRKVYPYQANKAVIGYDILKDPKTRKEALKAIDVGKMYFAGPFDLLQGGTAVVGRLPVFKNNKFWGFSAVIIKLESLLEQAELNKLAGEKYIFQFSKINPESNEEQFFLQNDLDIEYNISETILLPDGDWKFYIALKNPKEAFYELIPMAFFILLIASWLGWVVTLLFKQPIRLQALVNSQAGELAASELKFRTIFNQAAVGMVRVETATGKFLETNQRFRELSGYSASELNGMNFREISHPSEINENLALIQQLLNGDIREYSLEKRLIQKSGNVLWVKLSVSPLWKKDTSGSTHIAIIEDISERVVAQNELMKNEKRYRALVENGGEVVTIFNRKGQAIYSSPAIQKIAGYSEAEINSVNLSSLIHPKDIAELDKQILEAMKFPSKPISGFTIRAKNKKGEWRWAESTITNLLEDSSVKGFVGNFRDVSEKKEAEINLNKSYQMVMEQNRRLLNFSYIVSHNLRSHSSNIQAILNLYNTTSVEEEKLNYIGLLSKVGNALNHTLEDLNEVVSISTNLDLNIESLQINAFLNKTIDLLEMQISDKGAIIKRDVPDEMIVKFNAAYLESVLLNFRTNAIRYREQKRKLEISILGYKENGDWILEIADNGVGIDLERHGGKIFGLYKTFTQTPNSRGVGLFITRNQIEAMGGSVAVESEVGVGSVFKIYFK
ncbi:PAS domain S-box protein [Gillisia hiemivivida]|uniref:histidine kinase n=1 Tax=Gillisia hiemivivida TaxID=291190 RepID=A0A5C6ZU90_9FLAO|nr:PAS domain S-box protein [Gillisia hiemivivida]TXD92375.1 PAS domain S-box protein [Gillisia hiemivivida]